MSYFLLYVNHNLKSNQQLLLSDVCSRVKSPILRKNFSEVEV